MTFTLPTIDLTAVSPLLALLTTAIILLLLPLFFRSVGRNVLALLGAIGLLISGACLFRIPVVPTSGFDVCCCSIRSPSPCTAPYCSPPC